ncbi:MAG: hypothetical protein N2B02_04480, partial [Amylibacter sp.]
MKQSLIAIVCWILMLVTGATAETKKIYTILWEGCEHACQGYVDLITESGFDAEIILRDVDQDKSRLPGFIQEARDMDVDLVSTYGTSVTLGIAGTMDTMTETRFINDIPLVFWYVSDPFGTGIAAGFDASGRANITGTYNRVPEQVNINAIKNFLPEFQSLGMIYNS